MTTGDKGAPLFSMPNLARVYDYMTGGPNHFAADEELACDIEAGFPGATRMARWNREFLKAGIQFAARRGVGQFADIGTGWPVQEPREVTLDGATITVEATHATARAVIPSASVAYVDNDKVAIGHAKRLYGTDPRIAVLEADVRDVAGILADQSFRRVIGRTEPLCVVLGFVLHFLPADEAREVTAAWIEAMAPGSVLVISCAHNRSAGAMARAENAVRPAGASIWNHTEQDIASFFHRLRLAQPGVVSARRWTAHHGGRLAPVTPGAQVYAVCAAGVKE